MVILSPKLAVLTIMAAVIVVGAGSPTMAAATIISEPPEAPELEVDVERNNEIDQDIEQEQEACTNESEVKVSEEGKGDQFAVVDTDQSNDCVVVQTQAAANTAAIVDGSINVIDIDAILASLGIGNNS